MRRFFQVLADRLREIGTASGASAVLGVVTWGLRSANFDIPRVVPLVLFFFAGALVVALVVARLVAPPGKAYVYFQKPSIDPRASVYNSVPFAAARGCVSNLDPGEVAHDVGVYLTVRARRTLLVDRAAARWTGGHSAEVVDLPPDGRLVLFDLVQENHLSPALMIIGTSVKTEASSLSVKVEVRGRGMEQRLRRRYTVRHRGRGDLAIRRRRVPW